MIPTVMQVTDPNGGVHTLYTRMINGVSEHSIVTDGHVYISEITGKPFDEWAKENGDYIKRYGFGPV